VWVGPMQATDKPSSWYRTIRLELQPRVESARRRRDVSGAYADSDHGVIKLRCPLYPQQRTFLDAIPMSDKGQ
jgi:hypothetical protein